MIDNKKLREAGLSGRYWNRKLSDGMIKQYSLGKSFNNLIIDTSKNDNEDDIYSLCRAFLIRYSSDISVVKKDVKIIHLFEIMENLEENKYEKLHPDILIVPDFSNGCISEDIGDILKQRKLEWYFINRIKEKGGDDKFPLTILNSVNGNIDPFWSKKFENIIEREFTKCQ